MNDWIVLLLLMFAYAMAILYAASRPRWLVAVLRQVERPVRWLGRKMRRNR
jgi:hypothetical protein